MRRTLATVAKALAGGVVAGLGAAATAASDGEITSPEWWLIASAAAGSAYAVWRTPNAQQETGDDASAL